MIELIEDRDLVEIIIDKIGISIDENRTAPRYPQNNAKSIIKRIIERYPLDEKIEKVILNLPFKNDYKQELKQVIIKKKE
jgi:hypothetical protein